MNASFINNSGIFIVTGAMVPIQIIESKLLSEGENIWIRNLTSDLSKPEQDLCIERIYG